MRIKAGQRKILIIIFIILFATCGYILNKTQKDKMDREKAQIYLYGEEHGNKKIIGKEAKLWSEFYHEQGMRHLFLEIPYYDAEFLNIWMGEEDDLILDQFYKDIEGTQAHVDEFKEFFKAIKKSCPQTIFHGTDLGHQYQSSGKRYLNYLKERGLESSEKYKIAEEVIDQGRIFYENKDFAYREEKMVENFIREYDSLNLQKIMGIYGSAHISIKKYGYDGESEPMVQQLREYYGDIIYVKDLTELF